MGATVWEWLGISEEEFRRRVLYGACIKCGQTAKSKESCLCIWHTRTYHRWVNRKERGEAKGETMTTDFHVGDAVRAIDRRAEATYNKVGVIQSLDHDNLCAVVHFEGDDPTYGVFPFQRIIALQYLTKVK